MQSLSRSIRSMLIHSREFLSLLVVFLLVVNSAMCWQTVSARKPDATFRPYEEKASDYDKHRQLSKGNLYSSGAGSAVPTPTPTPGLGRLLLTSGNSFGHGIYAINPDYLTNPNDANSYFMTNLRYANLAEHPSVAAKTGMIALQTCGEYQPLVDCRNVGRRIFVMENDGSNIRQLTFPTNLSYPPGQEDLNPVISPDGTKVAFISNHTTQYAFPNNGPTIQPEVFVINTDGTNLHQVSSKQSFTDGFGNIGQSQAYSVVWSPDSSKLLVNAYRQATDSQGNTRYRYCYLFFNPDGTGEQFLLDAPTTYNLLDWSPDGKHFVYLGLGGYQIQDLNPDYSLGGDHTITPSQFGGTGSTDEGTVRFSPDSQQIVYGAGDTSGNQSVKTINLDGTNSTLVVLNGPEANFAKWWQAGAAIPKPDHLTLTPNPVVFTDQQIQQVTPTLYDTQGNVIFHAAFWNDFFGTCPTCGFRCDNTPNQVPCAGRSNPTVNYTGIVTGDGTNGIVNLCASNAGLLKCASIINSDLPVVTVSATTPTAAEAGPLPGVFTLTRISKSAPTDPLQVNFMMSGTATEGTDYVSIGVTATIPSGQTTVSVNVAALNDSLVEGDETVILTIQPDARYVVGAPADQATVTILDNGNAANLSLLKITPDHGGDGGVVSATIYGQGIQQGATVMLTRAGQTDIVGEKVNVGASGTNINAVFNLIGKADGAWNVVVTNPGGTSNVLSSAFTIEASQGAKIWVDVIGRDVIREGREATFTILYGNRGDADAFAVPLWIAGIPTGATVKLDFNLIHLPQNSAPWDPNQISPIVQTNTEQVMPLLIPVIPAGQTRALRFRMTTADIPGSDIFFKFTAWVSPPILRAVNKSSNAKNPLSARGSRAHHARSTVIAPQSPALLSWEFLTSDQGLTCFNNVLQAVTSCGLGVLGANCIEQVALLMLNGVLFYAGAVGDNGANPSALSLTQLFATGVGSSASCAAEILKKQIPLTKVLTVISCWASLKSARDSCDDGIEDFFGRAVHSRDPNAKVGSQGFGPQQFTSGAEPLRYAVYFENVETATASVQEVFVTDQLDASKLDLTTLSFGPIAFGNNVIAPTTGLTSYSTDVDLRPGKNLIVHITANLNSSTGVLSWHFQSIDPATGLPTTDPLAGFLPPNASAIAPAGEGNVLFTVMPKPGLVTGTQINNRATVFFDANAPINTPTWLNTIDNDAPSSHALSIAANQCPTTFQVQWAGTDTGSGVRSFTIFVSDNGGPFSPWQIDATATSAIFNGQFGHSYAFYSLAQDNAGNLEASHARADATVSFGPAAPPTIVCAAPINVGNEPGQCSARINISAPSVSDVCDASITPTEVRSDGKLLTDSFPIGQTTITWTAKNSNNLSASCQQIVTVNDTEPPKLSCPGGITVEFASDAGAALTLSPPIATDNCGAAVSGTRSDGKSLTDPYPIGATTVIWAAVDKPGNKTSCLQLIRVLGARGVKQNVVNDLVALRATIVNRQDREELDDVIRELTDSLSAKLWTDQTHLKPDGGEKVFDEDQETVRELLELNKHKKSKIDTTILQGLINRIIKSDRLLASVAISDAGAGHGGAKDIATAKDKLAEGDKDTAAGRSEGIGDYRDAWRLVFKPSGKLEAGLFSLFPRSKIRTPASELFPWIG